MGSVLATRRLPSRRGMQFTWQIFTPFSYKAGIWVSQITGVYPLVGSQLEKGKRSYLLTPPNQKKNHSETRGAIEPAIAKRPVKGKLGVPKMGHLCSWWIYPILTQFCISMQLLKDPECTGTWKGISHCVVWVTTEWLKGQARGRILGFKYCLCHLTAL